jgi:four helix bundle protein
MKKENIIQVKSYNFALRIIKLFKYLNAGNEYILSKQVLRSGTAIGAMIEESDQAESKADFIHKMGIANKEANETNYWIRLLRDSNYLKANEADSILNDCEEIQKIITAIIKTSKQNK